MTSTLSSLHTNGSPYWYRAVPILQVWGTCSSGDCAWATYYHQKIQQSRSARSTHGLMEVHTGTAVPALPVLGQFHISITSRLTSPCSPSFIISSAHSVLSYQGSVCVYTPGSLLGSTCITGSCLPRVEHLIGSGREDRKAL